MNKQFLLAVSFLALYASVTHGAALEPASGAKQGKADEIEMLVSIKGEGISWPNKDGYSNASREIKINKNMTWEELEKNLNNFWHEEYFRFIANTYGLDSLMGGTFHGLGVLKPLYIEYSFGSYCPSDKHAKLENSVGVMDLLGNQKNEKRISGSGSFLVLEIFAKNDADE